MTAAIPHCILPPGGGGGGFGREKLIFFLKLHNLYYYIRNFCNLIGLEQWYFSLI